MPRVRVRGAAGAAQGARDPVAVVEVGVLVAERAHRDVARDPRADAVDRQQRLDLLGDVRAGVEVEAGWASALIACARRSSTPKVAGSASASARGVGKRCVTVPLGCSSGAPWRRTRRAVVARANS